MMPKVKCYIEIYFIVFNGKSNLYFLFLARINFPLENQKPTRKRKADENVPKTEVKEITVEPYVIKNRGPYPYNKPKM